MNRKKADRIIVSSNARMQMVLDWDVKNADWLKHEEFRAPMESGVIELQEENLELTFRSRGAVVDLAIYVTLYPDLPPVVLFEYNPHTMIASNYCVAPSAEPEKRKILQAVIQFDETDKKEALKYHALMLFMTYYHETVEVKERVISPPASSKKKRSQTRKHRPLIRRTYILPELDEQELPAIERAKRPYTKPQHEVSVRGHYRRYKSGKVVWVGPSVRYKGKTEQNTVYKL